MLSRFANLRVFEAQKLERVRQSLAQQTAAANSSSSNSRADQESFAEDEDLEAENAAMQQELVQASAQRLDDVNALHQQMAEIATQNQQLAHILSEQSEVVDQLHVDAENTEVNVDKGNKELQQAVSRDSHSFRNMVVGLLVGASACLLFLDWFGS